MASDKSDDCFPGSWMVAEVTEVEWRQAHEGQLEAVLLVFAKIAPTLRSVIQGSSPGVGWADEMAVLERVQRALVARVRVQGFSWRTYFDLRNWLLPVTVSVMAKVVRGPTSTQHVRDVEDSGSGPAEIASARERLALAELLLELLPEEDRNVLLLKHVAQLSIVTIGEHLGVSPAEVNARLSRALIRARAAAPQSLQDLFGGSEPFTRPPEE